MTLQITEVDGEEKMETLLELHELTLPHDECPSVDAGRWWLALDGDGPVAFAHMVDSVQWMDTSFLTRCGVIPSYRGHGIQKRLIRARCQAAKRAGHSTALCTTNGAWASSNSLIACGFKLYVPKKPWGFETTLYWRRSLAT